MIGRRLAQYVVQSRLGAGGMGEVYRARDTRLGRDVAIKILPPALTSDKERLARFEREAHVLASLNHPNIGAIFGLEEAEGVRALVLELVEGVNLHEHLASHRSGLPVGEALGIAKQIAAGLEAAHEKGVIHRDLKPANIHQASLAATGVVTYSLRSKTFERLTKVGEWPTWLPDSRRILFSDGTGKYFYVIDSVTKEQKTVYTADREVLGDPRLSRDGRTAYFSRRVTQSDIWMMTLENKD